MYFSSLCRHCQLTHRICQTVFERAKSANTSASNLFGDVEMGRPDPVLGIRDAFECDNNPDKVNLGIGAYRDDNGEPWVLPSVEEAEKSVIQQKLNKEYLPIIGLPEFYNSAARLALGDKSKALQDQCNATMQTISGTGALRVAAEFLSKFWKTNQEIYLPTPTWGNHPNIFEHTSLKVNSYRYYDEQTYGLDFDGCMEDISKMPKGSIILLHPCGHNPTGVDPTTEQWCELSNCILEQNHYPLFDMAYQGFATGDVDRDAFAVRLFELDGHQFCVTQSFAKNMGLYGERVGALTFVCGNKDEAERVLSQCRIIIRSLYSSPPLHGARIAAEILNNDCLCEQWMQDVKTMAKRIQDMRKALKEKLKCEGSKLNWNHITCHNGMFCFTGLSEDHVECLIKDYGIHLPNNGRISISGINTSNVEYIAKAIHEVTK